MEHKQKLKQQNNLNKIGKKDQQENNREDGKKI